MIDLIKRLNISDSNLINVLLVVLALTLVALIVNLFITKVLKRLVSFTKSTVDDQIIDALQMPIFFTIILASLNYGFSTLGLVGKSGYYAQSIINTLIAIIWAVALIRLSSIILSFLIRRIPDTSGLNKSIVFLIGNVTKTAIIIAMLMAILGIWSIDITPLLASAGIMGIAVAVASKDTLSNFFGGISVFLDKPYKIGDYVELDNEDRGEVVHIGIRSTRIKTRDDILISIPNAIIANSKIVNESAPEPRFRVRTPIGAAYGSDIELVERVLLEVAAANKNIVQEPEPRVRFRKFGDSSLDFELLCWAQEPAMRGLTLHQLNKEIYHAFAKNGIQIPFPQRDVHFYKSGENEDDDN